MSEPSCPGCRDRDALLAAWRQAVERLEARVKDLEARLGQNSSNSSLPPSQNPLHAPSPKPKKRSRRKRGGQPGHKGHHRALLPPERVRHTIGLVPSRCGHCRRPLPQAAQPGDPPPTRHQVAELPRSPVVVTEFQGHARTCPCCLSVTREAIPAEITADAFGPRLAATLSYLAGCQHVSQRGLEEVVETVLDVPVSLGTIAALQRQTSQALAASHEAIHQEVRAAEAKYADETGWKLRGQRCWLWVAVTYRAVCYLVQARRNAAARRHLLGDDPKGVVISDRFGAYAGLPLAQRQLCWAHLKRDFQAMAERQGEARAAGEGLLGVVTNLFWCWRRLREGKRDRGWFQRLVAAKFRPEVERLLLRGLASGCAKTAETCCHVLEAEEALWTFAAVEGVEPTNNAAERALRPAVIWRKKCFGSQSEAGCVFVGRLLSAVGTLRKQGRRVLDYLTEAIQAHRHALPAPAILPSL